MKFIQIALGKYEVRHENEHFCGYIEYNLMWERCIFRPENCGLDTIDTREISKFMKKLNRKYK